MRHLPQGLPLALKHAGRQAVVTRAGKTTPRRKPTTNVHRKSRHPRRTLSNLVSMVPPSARRLAAATVLACSLRAAVALLASRTSAVAAADPAVVPPPSPLAGAQLTLASSAVAAMALSLAAPPVLALSLAAPLVHHAGSGPRHRSPRLGRHVVHQEAQRQLLVERVCQSGHYHPPGCHNLHNREA